MAAKFPTELNNFSEGDTIESEEWNAIEAKIGIDNSNDVASLDYLTKQAVNPGHQHSSLTQDLNMNTHKITNVVDPTANQDAATKKYVDDNSINNVVEDTTPQLGGNLDVNGKKIVSTANGDIVLEPNGTGRVIGVYRYIEIRLLDKDTAVATGTGVGGEFRVPRAMTVKNVGAYVDTASTSGLPTIDINEAGTSILSTKITIDVNEKTSTTAATPPVISDSAIAANAIITFDVDVAGTGAKGLVVWMEVIM